MTSPRALCLAADAKASFRARGDSVGVLIRERAASCGRFRCNEGLEMTLEGREEGKGGVGGFPVDVERKAPIEVVSKGEGSASSTSSSPPQTLPPLSSEERAGENRSEVSSHVSAGFGRAAAKPPRV